MRSDGICLRINTGAPGSLLWTPSLTAAPLKARPSAALKLVVEKVSNMPRECDGILEQEAVASLRVEVQLRIWQLLRHDPAVDGRY